MKLGLDFLHKFSFSFSFHKKGGQNIIFPLCFPPFINDCSVLNIFKIRVLGNPNTKFSCTDGKALVGAQELFVPIRYLLSQNGQLKVFNLALVVNYNRVHKNATI